VLLTQGKEGKPNWRDSEKDCKDFKSKHKNKSRDLNILQKEVKKRNIEVQQEETNWIKGE
jgi:hypothetical protein